MNEGLGKILIILGVLLAAIGALVLFSDKIPFLGKLPGDITIKRGSLQVFIPITSCIVLSILLSAILWLLLHVRGK